MKNNWIFILIVFFCSCHNDIQLEKALQLSGNNRVELEKVIEYYKNNDEKRNATRFLICNMIYHNSITSTLYSPTNKTYKLNFANKKFISELDSLKKEGYIIRTHTSKDIENIKADFLIENIELAFAAWKKPWSNKIPFHDFCRYILPYRSEGCPVSNLRQKLMQQYIPYLDSLAVTTPLEAGNAINKLLMGKISFVETLPLQLTLEQVDKYHLGNCDCISSYVTFLMRALGIPVSQDITVWTKAGYGHSWCTILNTDGRWYPFAPAETMTDDYKKKLSTGVTLPAKVYRSVFEPIPNLFDFPDDGRITFLKNNLYQDVTEEYDNPTMTISVKVNNTSFNEKKLVYLCAYNMGDWKEIALGEYDKGYCRIKKVVGDNIFRIATMQNRVFQYLTEPFYIDFNGNISYFSSDTTYTKEVTLRKHPFYGRFRHWGGYWDSESQSFQQVPTIMETDSTLICKFPTNALIVMGTRWVHWQQRIYFIKGDSICKY